MKLKVQTLDAKAKGDIDLNDDVFGLEPRADILHRVVTWQREMWRAPAKNSATRRAAVQHVMVTAVPLSLSVVVKRMVPVFATLTRR